jgi:hypothetical protein
VAQLPGAVAKQEASICGQFQFVCMTGAAFQQRPAQPACFWALMLACHIEPMLQREQTYAQENQLRLSRTDKCSVPAGLG